MSKYNVCLIEQPHQNTLYKVSIPSHIEIIKDTAQPYHALVIGHLELENQGVLIEIGKAKDRNYPIIILGPIEKKLTKDVKKIKPERAENMLSVFEMLKPHIDKHLAFEKQNPIPRPYQDSGE